MEQGKIKFYDQKKGYGFIFPESKNEEIFLHKSQTDIIYA